jgi:hypothetical protein
MSSVLFEEAKDLYELCERTLSDAIQSPEDLEKETKPGKRFLGALTGIPLAFLVSLIEDCFIDHIFMLFGK